MHFPSPNRIDPADTAEVALFADALSISVEDLRAVIEKVGPMRPAIRFYVTRHAVGVKRARAREAARPISTTPFQPQTSSLFPQ